MATWKDLEGSVRRAAGSIWPATFASRLVHGRQIDAYAEIDSKNHVAIEVTEKKDIKKIQEDINKLVHVRNVNFSAGYIVTTCICVTSYDPTPAMINVGIGINIEIVSIEDFQSRFLPFDRYRSARDAAPFGSAIDPITGTKDTKEYVVVGLTAENGSALTANTVVETVSAGRVVVLVGEYGTGKSKCVEYVFNRLSQTAWSALRFPVAIDLRRCWGLKDGYEILARHLKDIGLPEAIDAFQKAYANGMLILLLDGFDELGVQLWSDDSSALKSMRADALAGVRDLVSKQRGGVLVAGRDHYFDGNDEMIAALGLANISSQLVRSNDEFSYTEIAEFMSKNGYAEDIPEWLPRKPLSCEFFLRVLNDTGSIIDSELDPIQFWNMLLNAICEREAKIHSSFDVDIIKRILVEVASTTRNKATNVGPISLSDIQLAFERVVGHAPIDQASALLQRLPGLGRVAADSDERRFVDTYLLDGLRATDVIYILDRKDSRAPQQNWLNPLGESGLLICGRNISELNLIEESIGYCRANSTSQNQTLILDIVCSILLSGVNDIDFGNLHVDGGYASVVDLSHSRVRDLQIVNSLIDRCIVERASVSGLTLKKNHIGVLEGISSPSAVPSWLGGNEIGKYSSIATTSRIKAANLLPAQKVLITILRKTFFQKGSGRKEEALLRGLGKLVKQASLDKLLSKLISENLLRKEKGDSGILYIPIRSNAGRAGAMLAELTLSKDTVWQYASSLEK